MAWNPLQFLISFLRGTGRYTDVLGQVEAISRQLPVIEFDLQGNVLTANGNFRNASGYSLAELRTMHHRSFVDAADRDTPAYRAFWDRLRAGQTQTAQYKRLGKDGKPIWVQATYFPILDRWRRPFKVVKHTVNVTEQMLKLSDGLGQLAAISKAQAVAEFELDGTFRSANTNFLSLTGYGLEELRGQHHRVFVDAGEREGPWYRCLWSRLARGEDDAGQYKAVAKGGREGWIETRVNAILGVEGKPFKVVQ